MLSFFCLILPQMIAIAFHARSWERHFWDAYDVTARDCSAQRISIPNSANGDHFSFFSGEPFMLLIVRL
jgi:hypothetical protein